jgi:hypothetical protein
MREGSLARRATGFGAALIAATGLISLLPRPGRPDPAVEGPHPGAEGPAERHLPTAGHEARDVGFWQMASGALGVLAFVGFGVGVAYWLYPAPDKTLAFQPPSAYPAPTLQSDTVADMDRFRAEQLQQLNGAYWIDRASGAVHLPIEDAMRLVAQDGIADWPRTPYPPVVPAR